MSIWCKFKLLFLCSWIFLSKRTVPCIVSLSTFRLFPSTKKIVNPNLTHRFYFCYSLPKFTDLHQFGLQAPCTVLARKSIPWIIYLGKIPPPRRLVLHEPHHRCRLQARILWEMKVDLSKHSTFSPGPLTSLPRRPIQQNCRAVCIVNDTARANKWCSDRVAVPKERSWIPTCAKWFTTLFFKKGGDVTLARFERWRESFLGSRVERIFLEKNKIC